MPCEPEDVRFQGIGVISRFSCEMARWLVTHSSNRSRCGQTVSALDRLATHSKGYSLDHRYEQLERRACLRPYCLPSAVSFKLNRHSETVESRGTHPILPV